MSTVFVSHATSDDEITNRIHNILASMEIKDWIDHINLKPADDWDESIQTALNTCDSGLFILSLNSCERRECTNEWRTILDHDKRLYVVLTETIPKTQFPYRLRTTHYIDLTRGFDEGMRALVDSIKNQSVLKTSVQMTVQADEPSKNNWIIIPNNSIEKNEFASLSIVIEVPFNTFDSTKQSEITRLVAMLGNAGVEEIRIVKKHEGSVILTLEMKKYIAERVVEAANSSPNLLAQYGIISVEPIAIKQDKDQSFTTQAKPSFRKNWPAWAKQLPRIKFDPTPNADFKLIDQQKLSELMETADEGAFKRIQDDIAFLDQELLPLFRERDYKASFHQNRYRLFQILYVVVPATATIFGGLQALTLVTNPNIMYIFAFIEVLVAFLMIYLLGISGREPALSLWLSNRRIAESLRQEYFRYIMRIKPYDDKRNEREMLLSKRTFDINHSPRFYRNEQSKIPVASTVSEFNRSDVEARFALFKKFALGDQRNYYTATLNAFRKAAYQTTSYRLYLLLIVGISSAVSGLLVTSQFIPNRCTFQNPTGDCIYLELIVILFVLISIAMPLLVAFFSVLTGLYQWDRGTTIYKIASLDLEVADVQTPLYRMEDLEDQTKVNTYVEDVLQVMGTETTQWGKPIVDEFIEFYTKDKPIEHKDAIEASQDEPPSESGSST